VNTEGIENWENIAETIKSTSLGLERSLHLLFPYLCRRVVWEDDPQLSRSSHFIRDCMGTHRIPPSTVNCIHRESLHLVSSIRDCNVIPITQDLFGVLHIYLC